MPHPRNTNEAQSRGGIEFRKRRLRRALFGRWTTRSIIADTPPRPPRGRLTPEGPFEVADARYPPRDDATHPRGGLGVMEIGNCGLIEFSRTPRQI